MANAFIKAEKVVRTALGMLEREIVLPRLVWRDAGGDFAGAKGDTISIRLPAYTAARTRVLRGGTPITVDELTETKVDVTLDTDVYKAVAISDEELTLDIVDFGAQVLTPVVASVARGIEDAVAAEMSAATYEVSITGVNGTAVWRKILEARKALNDARVPMANRVLAVGSELEVELLDHEKFVKVNESGSDDALRDAMIGRIAGMQVVTVPALPPDMGVAFHQTAFVLSMKSPVVPQGAAWGASQSFAGLAMRALRDYDFLNVRDRLLADVFVGTNVVLDDGYFDANGLFVPDISGGAAAVTLATSESDDDIIDTATAHGFDVDDTVVFSGLTGGAGLTDGTTYYVIAANLGAQTFQVSTTAGGSAVNWTTDITAGTVSDQARPILVRAVKLTA